jgi:FlaA1/EpsC-like NDP-sugar epimerase
MVRAHRIVGSATFDSTCWVLGYYVFAWLRLDTTAAPLPWREVGVVAAVTVALYLAGAAAVHLFQGRVRVASQAEMLLLGVVMGGSGFAVFATNLIGQWIPRSVPAGATVTALAIAAWARAAWRRLDELDDERSTDGDGRRVLVVGAGEAGRDLISSMIRDPRRTWRPVGLLDDDPYKSRLRIRGVPVVGTTDRLAGHAERLGVQAVVLALPSVSSEQIHRPRAATMEAGLMVKVLPASSQLLRDQVGNRDLRDVNITDVLGRKQIDTDVAPTGYLRGRRVLVTGEGGSIGAELCRQIHRYQPAELLMLDRDESALHGVQLTLNGRALLDGDDVILCDIRDRAALGAVFERRRPNVVFHTAALKHLPMLEAYPVEAVKTNVQGTANVLDAADRGGRGQVRQRLHGQGGQPAQRARLLQAGRRDAHCRSGQADRRHVPVRAVRQRARQPRVGAHLLRQPDRGRRSGHRHRPLCHRLLHDHRGGLPAGRPGRRDRRARRGARSRHGETGADRGRGPAGDRAVRHPGGGRLVRPA